ncbi:MAG: right-handed parallel beta-helix repeat-containing protein [Nanoarchaeota archaeon]|nr:right-handed parallel beta-helix repeat-containing protein [Nanoarchaeota archaeon]
MNKTKIKYGILIFIILLLVSVIISQNTINLKINPKSSTITVNLETLKNFITSKINPKKINTLLLEMENILPIYYEKSLINQDLPTYNIKLSTNDLNYIDLNSKISLENGYLVPQNWREATFFYNNTKYPIKIKIKGDGSNHWESNLKSYKIKIINDSISRVRTFHLTIFEDRTISEMISQIINKELNQLNIKRDIVNLQINGVPQGLYSLQENIDKDMLEKNKLSNCVIIKGRDDYNSPFNNTGHITYFITDISNSKEIKTELDQQKILNSLNEFYNAYNQNDSQKLLEYVNKEEIARFEAFHTIIGSPHMISGDNLNLKYCTTNGKFEPIPIAETIQKLKLEKGGFEHNLFYYQNKKIPIFSSLIQDPEIRDLRNQILYETIKNNSIENDIQSLIKESINFVPSYKKNKISTYVLRKRMHDMEDAIKFNLKLIKENLEYSKVYINVLQESNKINLEIMPDSLSPLIINNMVLKFKDNMSSSITLKINSSDYDMVQVLNTSINGNQVNLTDLKTIKLSPGLDNELYPKKKTYNVEIIFNDVENIKLINVDFNIKNSISQQQIEINDIYFNIGDNNENYLNLKNYDYDSFSKTYNSINWFFSEDTEDNYENKENIILTSGTYQIKENIIIPQGYNFIIKGGVKIFLSENKSIISYSPTYILGEENLKVTISPLHENKPFGVIGVVGNSNNKETIINHLIIKNGNEHFINGIYFSGALSIYHIENVKINNSYFEGGTADDGINIKYANNTHLENLQFYKNSADQIDLDFCNGIIKKSVFIGGANDNGDGLDVSGSQIIITNNTFLNFQDKGLSIGEQSTVLINNNHFRNNYNAIAIKDLSIAYLFNNSFLNNKINITAYQKKEIYGMGKVYQLNNTNYFNKGK